MGSFQILEHTADVGIRATGDSLEEVFKQAALGLAEILGASRPGAHGEDFRLDLEAADVAALLVYWLSDILYLQESRDALITDVRPAKIDEHHARGTLTLAPRGEERLAGTAVKAVTYHQLKVRETDEGWVAEVYLDV